MNSSNILNIKSVKLFFCVLALAVFVTMLSGCGASEEEILADFGKLTEGFVSPAKIEEVYEYMDENISKVSEHGASHMLMDYEDFLTRYISSDADKGDVSMLITYYDSEAGSIDLDKMQGSEALIFYENIEDKGLLVREYEGSVGLAVDYNELAEKYQENILPAMYDLFKLRARGVEHPMQENAALMISWEELAERAMDAEELIREYDGEEAILQDASYLYSVYISTMLKGTTNSPIFSYSTGEFDQEAKAVYMEIIAEKPDTTIAQMLEKYFDFLEGIDYQLDYNDTTMNKAFFDTCESLISDASQRLGVESQKVEE